MALTGNAINELIICLISHQCILCVQPVYDPDTMEATLVPKNNQRHQNRDDWTERERERKGGKV